MKAALKYNFFSSAESELIRWVSANSSPLALREDTYIIQEGSFEDGIFIFESGHLRITTTAADGTQLTLDEQGDGGMVGEMSWLESRPAVASVLAEAGSRLLHLSHAVLEALQRDAQPSAALLYRAIGSKLSLQIQSQNAWIHRFPTSTQEPLRNVFVLFADLYEQDVDWLRQLGRLRCLPAGGLLFAQGDPVEALALILAGEARVQVEANGEQRIVGSSGRGELLGEMSLFNTDCPSASARVDTLDGLELLDINIATLLEALAGNRPLATRFWRALARMLSQRSRDQLLQRGLAATSREAEAQRDEEEIDVAQLSGISTAGARFDWLCRQFQNQAA